jgi:hypothetical protein
MVVYHNKNKNKNAGYKNSTFCVITMVSPSTFTQATSLPRRKRDLMPKSNNKFLSKRVRDLNVDCLMKKLSKNPQMIVKNSIEPMGSLGLLKGCLLKPYTVQVLWIRKTL